MVDNVFVVVVVVVVIVVVVTDFVVEREMMMLIRCWKSLILSYTRLESLREIAAPCHIFQVSFISFSP